MKVEDLRITIISTAAGAFIGSFCSHFNFTGIEHWTCVISAAVIIGMLA